MTVCYLEGVVYNQRNVAGEPPLSTSMIQSQVHGGEQDDETVSCQVFILIGKPTRYNIRRVGLEILVDQAGDGLGKAILLTQVQDTSSTVYPRIRY